MCKFVYLKSSRVVFFYKILAVIIIMQNYVYEKPLDFS